VAAQKFFVVQGFPCIFPFHRLDATNSLGSPEKTSAHGLCDTLKW
jgi:hypothetical protein